MINDGPARRDLAPVDEQVRYDFARDMFFRARTDPPHATRPLSVCISVGQECNLACRVCLSSSAPGKRFLPASRLREVKLLVASLEPLRIVWSGGEPTRYPAMPDLLRFALQLRHTNVVSSNLLSADCLSELAGRFFFNVSIYGVDEHSYRVHTRLGNFSKFRDELEQAFATGHKISASIRVCSNWRSYLGPFLEFVRQYPFCRLSIRNTQLKGRNTVEAKPVCPDGLMRLRAYVTESEVRCPVIVPSTRTEECIRRGFIAIDPSLRGPSFGSVSGSLCSTWGLAKDEVLRRGVHNRRLFTLEDYVSPNEESV